MKVTIYELLGMVKDGKAPKKIMYNNETFTLREEKDDYANQNHWFTDRICLLDLNKEVEIIEEDKKIEKLDTKDLFACDDYQNIRLNFGLTWSKINEIIDKLEEK